MRKTPVLQVSGFLAVLLCSCGDEGGAEATSSGDPGSSSTSGAGAQTSAPTPSGGTQGSATSTGATPTTGRDSSVESSSSDETGLDASGGGPTDSTGETGSTGLCGPADIISEAQWDEFFLHKDDDVCAGEGSYTYAGFVEAAAAYPTFGCEGSEAARIREVAAFLGQISHETTGGWATAPDGPHAWGLCFIEEVGCEAGNCTQYCETTNATYPCAEGQTYQGRGAIQLSWNYNYGQAGDALGLDLLGSPNLVRDDPAVAIQTALWFWMTAQPPKPSAHDVMVGVWEPTAADVAAGRVPGYGMTTNIINGGIECNQPTPASVADRVGFFERYSGILGTNTGDALFCDQMTSY